MNIIEILIAFIGVILGIAYPIILEVISRLDEKYNSSLIVQLIKNERIWLVFHWMLYTSLVCSLAYIVVNLPFLQINYPKAFSYPFITIFIASVVALVVSFLLFVKKVMLYYTPSNLIHYLQRQKETEEHLFFQATNDVLLSSLTRSDVPLAITASDYIYKSFRNFRLTNRDKPVEYPAVYYNSIKNLIQELLAVNNRRFRFLEHRSVGGIWLLGERDKSIIHEQTFNWIWSNLLLSLEDNRDDQIMMYWENAHYHYIYELNDFIGGDQIQEEGNQGNAVEEPRNLQIERVRFLEFNHALGGLLMYKKRYNCLRRVFRYTSSSPPRQDLLPIWMDDVFKLYFKFRDPYQLNFPFITMRYWFPESEGLNAEGLVKFWICKYAALLFLRQYTINKIFVYMEPLKPPAIPSSQREKKMWIDNLGHFKSLVEKVFADKELLEEIGLGHVTEEWITNKREESLPSQFFDDLIKLVNDDFNETEINQPISEQKLSEFRNKSVEIIVGTIDEYKKTLTNRFDDGFDSYYIKGSKMVAEKSAFSDNQVADHVNFDTFLAHRVVEDIHSGIGLLFKRKTTDSYLLKSQDIFPSLQRLNLSGEQYIILNFGIDLDYYAHSQKISELAGGSFQSLTILSFPAPQRHVMNPTLFVIERTSLPNIETLKMDQDIINSYQLKKSDGETFIYSNVIDLNENQTVKGEVEAEEQFPNLEKSVLVYIGLNLRIQWRKEAQMLALSEFNEFRNRGLPHEARDVSFVSKNN